MVHLSVHSTRNGVRYYPHKGFLGLTPVRVEGLLRTKLDADGKLLPATSITVAIRCLEARMSRTGSATQHIVVERLHTLWSKPEGSESADIGELELPFRITLPIDVGGYSTASFVEYRCCWKVEAVLNHLPIVGVGSRQIKSFDLPLLRHSIPKQLPAIPPPNCISAFKQIRPDLDYSLCIPPASYGPLDLIAVVIRLRTQYYHIRSASVTIERRISFKSVSIASPSNEPAFVPSDDASDRSAFTTSDTKPLIPFNPAPVTHLTTPVETKTIAAPITAVESSGQFSQDLHGSFSKTLTLKWPDTKSNSRWAVGETLNSDFCSIRFYARAKITLGTPTGHEVVELPEHEVTIVSTNEAQRQLAISKAIDDGLMPQPGQSKPSTRRSRHGMPETTSAGSVSHEAHAQSPGQSRTNPSSQSALLSPLSIRRRPSSHRPHTSAGPRDKPKALADRVHMHPSPKDVPRRKMGANSATLPSAEPRMTTSPKSSFTHTLKWPKGSAVRPTTQPQRTQRSESGGSDTTISSSESAHTPISAHVLAWEEELARIEAQSRRSSAKMFGFLGNRPPQHRKEEQRVPLRNVSCQ